MSITVETANQHKNAPAVVCCLTKKGTVLSPSNLEDPNIFPDLVEAGLLKLPKDVLTIGEVIGVKLLRTIDALTPITSDMVEVNEGNTEYTVTVGKNNYDDKEKNNKVSWSILNETEKKIKRSLLIREFKANKVKLGEETSFKDDVLTIRAGIVKDALKVDQLLKKIEIDIVGSENKDVFTNTILDVMPIATKIQGKIGEGITNVISGAVVILTGIDEEGIQVHEFGSCEGIIGEKIRFGRPGSPDENDIIIRINVTIEEGTGMERRGPYAAHKGCDAILQEIRKVLKEKSAVEAVDERKYEDIERKGRQRVVLVKEIMGQGAMHDNIILPKKPAGVFGGIPNVDLGNMPIVLSPNEVRDGGIHALTCVGPASKETTRHYFREPLVNLMSEDDEINLVGIIFVGSPQANDEKLYVSERLGTLIEALDVEGAIVTTEGFGNNHIDFASHIEQIGKRGISVVGVTYAAVQGQLVVGNKYMDAMIELNKDPDGIESEILGENTLCEGDAKRALAMLKAKMSGIPIKPSPMKWDKNIIESNLKLVEGNLK